MINIINSLINVFLVTFGVFLIFMVIARAIGRKLLSGMTFFDYITGATMGSIAGGFINHYFKGAPVSIFSLVVMGLLLIITGKITLYDLPVRKLISGEPLVIIHNGKMLENNMKKARYDVDNLMSNLRQKGIFDFSIIEFAILEPNGKLSIQKKSQFQPVTPADLRISTKYKGLPYPLVRDGQIAEENLALAGLNKEWLTQQLQRQGIMDVGCFFCFITNGW